MTGSFDPPFCRQLWDLFRLRRDVRRFRTEPVAPEVIRHVLSAAHLAPSVGLSQPWRFLLIEDASMRDRVAAEFERSNHAASRAYDSDRAAHYRRLKLAGLREAPVHLLVCAEHEPRQGHGLGRQSQPETVRDSVVCAIENLWLAATAVGLGVGWVSILEPSALRAPLEVPEQWTWVAYLCIGWPERYAHKPVLETEGWEHRRSLDEMVFRR